MTNIHYFPLSHEKCSISSNPTTLNEVRTRLLARHLNQTEALARHLIPDWALEYLVGTRSRLVVDFDPNLVSKYL